LSIVKNCIVKHSLNIFFNEKNILNGYIIVYEDILFLPEEVQK